MFEISKWFSTQYWEGKRWIVLDDHLKSERLGKCYEEYNQATAYCRRLGDQGQTLRIRVLADLLKERNMLRKVEYFRKDIVRLKEVMSLYPVGLFYFDAEWEGKLLQGSYYPVLWKKVIIPLRVIERYIVACKDMEGREELRELYTSAEFPEAITAFLECSRGTHGRRGCLLLYGRLYDMALCCDTADKYNGESIIVLYRVEWQDAHEPDITQVHDPCATIVKSIPVFVRYHAKIGALHFYDGRLRRIRPGDEPGYMDFRWFDFRRNNIVKSGIEDETR